MDIIIKTNYEEQTIKTLFLQALIKTKSDYYIEDDSEQIYFNNEKVIIETIQSGESIS